MKPLLEIVIDDASMVDEAGAVKVRTGMWHGMGGALADVMYAFARHDSEFAGVLMDVAYRLMADRSGAGVS